MNKLETKFLLFITCCLLLQAAKLHSIKEQLKETSKIINNNQEKLEDIIRTFDI